MYSLDASSCAHEAELACLRNIVATVNLDCRLDLKTIALHARNAEYNPKVLLTIIAIAHLTFLLTSPAFRGRHHAYP